MIARDQLDSAVTAGILTGPQADRLVRHLDPASAAHDPEEVRFTRGFHDIFIALGIAILLVGAYSGLAGILPEGLMIVGPAPFVAALVWGLAEIFVVRKRLALPAILLALAFAPLVVQTVLTFYDLGADLFGAFDGNTAAERQELVVALGAGLLATLVFQFRFKVPITYAATAAMAAALALAGLDWLSPGIVETNITLLMLIAGLAIFAGAMAFDVRDVDRTSLNTDKAFWLHLLAAPMIVHSSLAMLVGDAADKSGSFLVIALVCGLALVALIVDRRALLVSGLTYLGIAIGTLLKDANFDETVLFAGTLVILGLIVLMLGSGWNALRALLMQPLSGTALAVYLPSARN